MFNAVSMGATIPISFYSKAIHAGDTFLER